MILWAEEGPNLKSGRKLDTYCSSKLSTRATFIEFGFQECGQHIVKCRICFIFQMQNNLHIIVQHFHSFFQNSSIHIVERFFTRKRNLAEVGKLKHENNVAWNNKREFWSIQLLADVIQWFQIIFGSWTKSLTTTLLQILEGFIE